MKIKSNGKARPVIFGSELTEKEKKNFDWYSQEELENALFMRYKGIVYDLREEFLPITETMVTHYPEYLTWDSYHLDGNMFIRYCNDFNSVIVGIGVGNV